MSKFIGAFLALFTLGVAVVAILWMWGVIDLSIWGVGKFILTGVILLVTAGILTAIYGMFFWKGGKEPVPGDQKTAGSEFIGNRYSDNK